MQKKLKFSTKIILPFLHIIVWGCFLFYPFIFYTTAIGNIKEIIRHSLIIRHFFSTILLVAFFYSNVFILIPKLLAKKKIVLYIGIIILIIVLIILANIWFQYLLNWEFFLKHYWMKFRMISGVFFSTLLVWGVSSGLKITTEWLKNEQLKKEMETEKLSSELTFLKSQVNPHFLFNSLNSIYALSNKKSEDTPAAIVKLSDLMRYMLYETSDDLVELEKEVAYLKNYIDLQKLRVKKTVKITFNIDGDLTGKKIEPMLLVPFVENAFKHGISYRNNSFIFIDLKSEEEQLFLRVENSVYYNKENKDKMPGIGLKNVKRRLELLYPNKHQLDITETKDKFVVELILQNRY